MLSIKNLHAKIGDNQILNGITLEVKPGEVHAIMGPNGSGKSTLASVLAGREEFEVTAGEATYLGKNLFELSPEDRAREGLFLAFQYPMAIPGVTVANCHKQPAHFFQKKLLSVSQIVTEFTALQASIATINPKINYIFTVSPVRHLKDSLELNAVGKAVLRLAVHEIIQNLPAQTAYFPAYELLLDDLRDYRFYAPDMLHPNEVGEEYIWKKFGETYFSTETQLWLKKIKQIQTSLAHRPLQENTTPHKDFLLTLAQEIDTLRPKISLEAEWKTIQEKLTKLK